MPLPGAFKDKISSMQLPIPEDTGDSRMYQKGKMATVPLSFSLPEVLLINKENLGTEEGDHMEMSGGLQMGNRGYICTSNI